MSKAAMFIYTKSDHALPYCKCVLWCCADCSYINIPDQEKDENMKKQHPQLCFTFITSLHVVLFMVELHWGKKYVTCVNKNLNQMNLEKYTPETRK